MVCKVCDATVVGNANHIEKGRGLDVGRYRDRTSEECADLRKYDLLACCALRNHLTSCGSPKVRHVLDAGGDTCAAASCVPNRKVLEVNTRYVGTMHHERLVPDGWKHCGVKAAFVERRRHRGASDEQAVTTKCFDRSDELTVWRCNDIDR